MTVIIFAFEDEVLTVLNSAMNSRTTK
jgi:hypothetical protein